MQPTAYQTALSSHGGFLPGSTELSKINDDFITDLDDTVKLLCRMSQMEGGYYHITMHGCHPHCRAYYAQCMTNLADPFCFNADVDDVSLKRYVDQQFSCTTQTVYYFERTFTDPYCQINFVVFSSEQRILSDHLSDLINMYLDQRTQAFQGNLLRHKLTNQVQALEDINLGRTKYLSVIAHDLRAPFHGILGCADILSHERTTLDEEATQRLINYIYDTTQSTYGLLENLLNWSMEEGGRFHQKCIEFDLKQRIEFVISLLNGLAFKKQIHFSCEVEDGLLMYADCNMVTSVIQNITSNAIKFTPAHEGRAVKVIAKREQDELHIMICDEGLGMSANQVERLFEEHGTPSTFGTSGEKGTGLGLILCNRFIMRHHGRIVVDSELNQGTCFHIYLPVRQPD